MRAWFVGAAAVTAAAVAGPAAAAPYNFTLGRTNGNAPPTIFATGTIYTGASCTGGAGCVLVTNVTGTSDGQAITGAEADPLYADQYFFPTSTGAKVDQFGISYFVADGTKANIVDAGSGSYNLFHYDAGDNLIGTSDFASFFTVTPADTGGGVPEPATWAMLVMGFGLVGAALRRRRFGAAALA